MIDHWIEYSLKNVLSSTPPPKMKVMIEFHPMKGGLAEKHARWGPNICFKNP